MIINGSLKRQNRKRRDTKSLVNSKKVSPPTRVECLIFPTFGLRRRAQCSFFADLNDGIPFVLDILFAIIYFVISSSSNDVRIGQKNRQERPHSVWHHRVLSRNRAVC